MYTITESLCYIPKTNTTLRINCTSKTFFNKVNIKKVDEGILPYFLKLAKHDNKTNQNCHKTSHQSHLQYQYRNLNIIIIIANKIRQLSKE